MSRSGAISIRRALMAGMLAVTIVPSVIVVAIGAHNLGRSVRREAQTRVNQDLRIVMSAYQDQLAGLESSLEAAAGRIPPTGEPPEAFLGAVRRELDLDLLNLCDVAGRPLDGRDPATGPIPVETDPVLRQALLGRPARGTVILDPDRLMIEGGPALPRAVVLHPGGSPAGSPGVDALAWWVAVPVRSAGGRVERVLYGGRILNHNNDLVDRLRDAVFGGPGEEGVPPGTVTIFIHDLRAATNVPGKGGGRAVGTRVSDAVRTAVLDRGENYTGEALVVNEWYLSAYRPLHEPGGRTVGMIYVGVPRRPYDEARNRLILNFLWPVALVGLLAVGAGWLLARRITRPVQALGHAVSRLTVGDWDHRLELPDSYRELHDLAAAYDEMQTALERRRTELRVRNEELSVANEKLALSNRNYMETLGFVTHELKAPLGAIQMLVSNVLDGYLGPVPEKLGDSLNRVRRNCEELQDMVRDYLDLSRLERGELSARPRPTDIVAAVIRPAVDQTAVFFTSRGIALQVEAPPELTAVVDPDLLRIAVNNYLINAAKYGREQGRAVLTVTKEADGPRVTVWNEGDGFPPEDADRLFDKFVRLHNATTQRRRGSGIGLFTVRNIAILHGGRAWAESEPGQWAAFHLALPEGPAPTTPV